MAISKRLRYEIFRRDSHTCRYCGRSAPEVVLHVDHVIPQALGGAEKDPSNLFTSCSECNGGKSASSPDQAVVADVSESAAKWKAAITQAADEARTNNSGRDALYEAVIQAWPSFHRKKLPGDFAETVDQFVDAGLPHEAIIEMAQLAGAKPSIYNRWAYFCGCCWTKIRQLQDRAIEIVGDVVGDEVRQEPDKPLVTTAPKDMIDMSIHFAVEHLLDDDMPARSVVVYNTFECFHKIKWNVVYVTRAVRENKPYPCEDVVCIASYGENLMAQYERCRMHAERDRNIMDAAEELELAH